MDGFRRMETGSVRSALAAADRSHRSLTRRLSVWAGAAPVYGGCYCGAARPLARDLLAA